MTVQWSQAKAEALLQDSSKTSFEHRSRVHISANSGHIMSWIYLTSVDVMWSVTSTICPCIAVVDASKISKGVRIQSAAIRLHAGLCRCCFHGFVYEKYFQCTGSCFTFWGCATSISTGLPRAKKSLRGGCPTCHQHHRFRSLPSVGCCQEALPVDTNVGVVHLKAWHRLV